MPKAQMIEPTTPRVYTVERLQELRHEADLAGDILTRDALSAKIHDMGGRVPSRTIPDNETKVGRLERLRQDALDVNDTKTAEALAELIAKEEPQLAEGDPEPEKAAVGGVVYDAPTEPQDAPVSDIERLEGPMGCRPVNDGTASANAMAMIEQRGYLLSDIPARFGRKVDLHDVKSYRRILEAE